MGWDVQLVIHTGARNFLHYEVGGVAWNNGPILKFLGLKELSSYQNKLAESMIPVLESALSRLHKNKYNPELASLDSLNGYDSVEDTEKFLFDFYMACIKHPLCTIDVS